MHLQLHQVTYHTILTILTFVKLTLLNLEVLKSNL